MTRSEARNVIGGPLDGGFIEPHDSDEAVQIARRSTGCWNWYQWIAKERTWVFVRSQTTVLK